MAIRRKSLQHKVELPEERVVAKIYVRKGQPFVTLVTGMEPHPVGRIVCVKAGMRAVDWESINAEKPMIELCEAASPVHRMMAQPHELVMKIVGQSRPWVYRPDLRLEVDLAFADAITKVPFAKAVADWRPTQKRAETVTLIVEVKDDADPRINDELYNLKLKLAGEVYRKIGWRFTTALRSRDIDAPAMSRAIRTINLDHSASVGPGDITAVSDLLEDGASDLRSITVALGGGGLGRAKAAALHARRIISIELENDFRPNSAVRLVNDGRAIFELPGRYPW